MLIHFYGIVLTNCAMCLMLNIMSYFIYKYKCLIIINPNVFVMLFRSALVKLPIFYC